jgi:hypothetical protein
MIGYDAADALADWPDLGALRKAAASLAKPLRDERERPHRRNGARPRRSETD